MLISGPIHSEMKTVVLQIIALEMQSMERGGLKNGMTECYRGIFFTVLCDTHGILRIRPNAFVVQ